MKAVVTGAAGFIGSHLSEMLLQSGYEVVGLDNLSRGRLENLFECEKSAKFSFVKADIRHPNEIEKHFQGADVVFHLAALADIVPSVENPKDYFDVNVQGSFNILEAARKNSVKRFIYAASSTCYGMATIFPTPESAPISPRYPYALTKNLGEQMVMHWGELYGLEVISLRMFNVYGPRAKASGTYGAVFGVFLAQLLHGRPLTIVGDGNQTRDFTYVADVAEAFIKAFESREKCEIFNVGSGGTYSINTLVKLLEAKSVVHIPKRPGEPDCTFADISKIKEKLHFEPKVSFEEGVRRLRMKINEFKDAPLWDEKSIEAATASWFKYLR